MFGSIFKLVQDLLTFVSPQILRLLINFVTPEEILETSDNSTSTGSTLLKTEFKEPLWKGIFYAALLFIVASTQTLFLAQYFQRMFLVGLRIRTALVGAIYKKALVLSNKAKKDSTVGEIVNLMGMFECATIHHTPVY